MYYFIKVKVKKKKKKSWDIYIHTNTLKRRSFRLMFFFLIYILACQIWDFFFWFIVPAFEFVSKPVFADCFLDLGFWLPLQALRSLTMFSVFPRSLGSKNGGQNALTKQTRQALFRFLGMSVRLVICPGRLFSMGIINYYNLFFFFFF